MTGMGSHQSAAADNIEWLTPPEVLGALGPFDLDPCAPEEFDPNGIPYRPWSTARVHYSISQDGLAKTWAGRAYVNCPYDDVAAWLGKLADHGRGTALTFARTETKWFFRTIWERATAVLFLESPRLHFYRIHATPHCGVAWKYVAVRAKANCGAPSVLVAYGTDDADRLADCGLGGAYVPLTGAGQVVAVFRPQEAPGISWGDLLVELAAREGGKLTVQAAYVLLAHHPKAAANANWKAKVRQVLQRRNLFNRTAPETYALEAVA